MKSKKFIFIIVLSLIIFNSTIPFYATAMSVDVYKSDVNSYISSSDYDPCANGHNYKLIGWHWNGYESAYAMFECQNKVIGGNYGSSHGMTKSALITSSVTTKYNGIVYTATVVCDGKTYTDTRIKLYTDDDGRIIGDVDADGKITSADSLSVLRNSVGLEYFSDNVKKIADVDKDGKITSADSLTILRYSVGLKDNSVIGERIR